MWVLLTSFCLSAPRDRKKGYLLQFGELISCTKLYPIVSQQFCSPLRLKVTPLLSCRESLGINYLWNRELNSATAFSAWRVAGAPLVRTGLATSPNGLTLLRSHSSSSVRNVSLSAVSLSCLISFLPCLLLFIFIPNASLATSTVAAAAQCLWCLIFYWRLPWQVSSVREIFHVHRKPNPIGAWGTAFHSSVCLSCLDFIKEADISPPLRLPSHISPALILPPSFRPGDAVSGWLPWQCTRRACLVLLVGSGRLGSFKFRFVQTMRSNHWQPEKNS